MTTEIFVPQIPTPQPEIDSSISPKENIPGTTPTSYAGYPGLYYTDPVTKKLKKATTSKFIKTMSYAGPSTIHGLGCFANTDILSGQLIEECSAILLDTTTKTNKDYVITSYLFTWPCEQNDPICKENGSTFFVPTGNALLYNHSDTPNSYWIYDKPMKRLFLSSLRSIAKGEEITWYYGHGYAKKLRNNSSGEENSNNLNISRENIPNVGCSSCEQRRKLLEEAQQSKQNDKIVEKVPIMSPPIMPHRSTVNRSELFKHMHNIFPKSNTPETSDTPGILNTRTPKEQLPINFRSMVVPEIKLNDTIQDGTI